MRVPIPTLDSALLDYKIYLLSGSSSTRRTYNRRIYLEQATAMVDPKVEVKERHCFSLRFHTPTLPKTDAFACGFRDCGAAAKGGSGEPRRRSSSRRTARIFGDDRGARPRPGAQRQFAADSTAPASTRCAPCVISPRPLMRAHTFFRSGTRR